MSQRPARLNIHGLFGSGAQGLKIMFANGYILFSKPERRCTITDQMAAYVISFGEVSLPIAVKEYHERIAFRRVVVGR